MRILFCDDIPMLREVVAVVLRKLGHEVDTSTDGQDALDKLQSNPGAFDLLITDNRMPRLSGIELVDKLRESNVPIKVVMASHFIEPPDPATIDRLRLDAVLRKPYSANDLVGCLNQLAN